MKKSVLVLLICSGLCISPARAAEKDGEFEKIAKDYVEFYLASHPEFATELGDHRFDGRLTDYSPDATEKLIEQTRKTRQALEAFKGGTGLSPENRIDARILAENLDRLLFELTELKEANWNPMIYNRSLVDAAYLLVAREFDTPEQRIANLRKRMEALPAVIKQAKANLQNPPRVHTATAIDQVRAAVAFYIMGLNPLLDKAPDLKKEMGPLQKETAALLEQYMKWLITELLPRSKGDFRIGAEKYQKKLKFVLGSDLSVEEIRQRAQADFDQTKAALYETAVPLYKTNFPKDDPKNLADKNKVIAAVLNKLGEKSLDPTRLVPFCDGAVKEATDFVRKKDFVTVPSAPLEVIEMPEFKRGEALAYCDAPGALEKNGKTFFAVSPAPNTWPALRVATFYREYNEYMAREVTAHEAVPGHYLQRAHSNQFQAPTGVRAIFRSAAFAEGWAVYGEQLMAEAGYGGPEVKMQQLKMRLRVDANALIDQGVHARNMTNREAMLLMMKDAFQEDGEATAKWKRAMLTSAQLSTYFVGMSEMLEMRDKAKAQQGQNFNLKKYNDQVLSYGTPPIKYVRELLGL